MKRIDMDTWSRREQYQFFSGMQWPYVALTCEVDITPLRSFMQARKLPHYISMIHLVTKAVNSVPQLRLRIEDGCVYEHEVVHPSFTLLDSAEELRFCRAQHNNDAGVFIARTGELVERIKSGQADALSATSQDVIYLSCVPWVHFTAVSHPMNHTPPDAIPRITWGRYQPRGERLVVAMSLQTHHGLADGLHISRFMLKLGELCAAPEEAFAGLK